MKSICVVSGKGGTGKTSLAISLAKTLAKKGKTGLVDADIDSSNVATELGVKGMIKAQSDRERPIIEPLKVEDNLSFLSIESAFDSSDINQKGTFLAMVAREMIENTEWGDLDYMIIDAPPGVSDIFDQVIESVRSSLVGCVVVGQSRSIKDVARMVTICNHNWLPIIGFVENMSGAVTVDGEEIKDFSPFGRGKIEKFASRLDGTFMGRIPLCPNTKIMRTHMDSVATKIAEGADNYNLAPTPPRRVGTLQFVKNIIKLIGSSIRFANRTLDVDGLQKIYGVEHPKTIQLVISDAPERLKRINFRVEDGKIHHVKAAQVDGIITISSGDLHCALRGKKPVYDAISHKELMSTYTITDAVKLGDATVQGDLAFSWLVVLDAVLRGIPKEAKEKLMTLEVEGENGEQ